MTTAALLDALRRRGITLSTVAGRLVVRPATALTTDDRAAIKDHLAELIAVLAAGPSSARGQPAAARATWHQQMALRLMFEADGLVEKLGVDGRHPVVADAAALVVSAHAVRDMAALRLALCEFETAVRGVRSSSGK